MSNASAVLPLTYAIDVVPLRDCARAILGLVGGALQMVGFAAVVWLMLAGPGFLADDPLPTRPVPALHR